MTVVLDAWAVVAFLMGERRARRVRGWIGSGGALMSSVNLGEALYIVTRSHGSEVARDRIGRLRRALLVEDPTWELVTAAAAVKAGGGLSYADAFCVATARRHRLPIATGDPELLEAVADIEIIDLRRTR